MSLAIVSGGAGGIGSGIADALLAEGGRVAVLDLRENPRATLSLSCDVTDAGAVAAAVRAEFDVIAP